MKSLKMGNPSKKRAVKAKSKSKVEEFDLAIVGLRYRVAKADVSRLQEMIDEEGGIPCRFEMEPDNQVDPQAVKVILLDPEKKVFHNMHIGYVRRPANGPLTDLLKRGATVKLCLLTYLSDAGDEAELQVGLIPPWK